MARREDREDQFSHARLSNEHVYGFERPGKAGRKKEGKETRIETDVLHLLIRINGFLFPLGSRWSVTLSEKSAPCTPLYKVSPRLGEVASMSKD